ncbi:hypothetical protein ASPTUDRAFT_733383 [Aspergillus tubingensis CBS 134.48]|uniref:Uncharacterized protein n=1 Tax=Aspergillus tubingensis (strain CBS 134.48) TaxID=767770 RepID=A0A1L9MXV5_ASPTC|nr:hypothetical protein ASPTUDRAFT_733383 [Aspergillus tubingensis CBS 134.48]
MGLEVEATKGRVSGDVSTVRGQHLLLLNLPSQLPSPSSSSPPPSPPPPPPLLLLLPLLLLPLPCLPTKRVYSQILYITYSLASPRQQQHSVE